MSDAATMREAFIGLGANLSWCRHGPVNTIHDAITKLSALGEVRARSAMWRSPAWPDPSRPEYVNAVVRLRTKLGPLELLTSLQALEASFGRARSVKNADRTLDLDVIDYAGRVESAAGGLNLPHPSANERAFVLLPLQEIAPLWRCPRSGRPISDLIEELPVEARAATSRINPVRSSG